MSASAIIDVDGTLVDSNYHHALAWHRALRHCGVVVPVWRIHRHIGIGGDKIVAALAGDRVDEEVGDEIRAAEKDFYGELIAEVLPLEGAHELLRQLDERGLSVVLASSAPEDEIEHYLGILDAYRMIDGYTTPDDVDQSKPAPDLVSAALELSKGSKEDAVMLGDSTWDIEAAGRAGLASVGVLTGGFAAAELREKGATEIHESLPSLIESLDDSALVSSD